MKKIISLMLVLVMVFAMAFCVSADAKTDVYDSYKANFPAKYQPAFDATVQSVLNQVPVSDEQAAQLIALIEEGKALYVEAKGVSLSEYTADEKANILDILDRACTALGVTYKIVPAANPTHAGDSAIEIYYNGVLIVTVDVDAVKVTGGNQTTSYAPLALALLATTMGLATLSLKKRTF